MNLFLFEFVNIFIGCIVFFVYFYDGFFFFGEELCGFRFVGEELDIDIVKS